MTTRPLKYLFAGTSTAHEWLTMAELADYGRFPSGHAAWCWLTRNPEMPRVKRGRMLLVDRAAFDRYMAERGRKTRVR